MSDLKQKVTLRLSPDVMQTAQDAVSLGIAPNATAFIEDAIRARAREVRHARMRQLAQEAMADPDFVADMHDTVRSFDAVAGENWPGESTSVEAAA
jgi:hypothetical protein